MSVSLALQIAAAILTLASTIGYGSRQFYGPALGVASQFPWWALVITNELWGLVPLQIGMTIISARNLYRWWSIN